VTSNSYNEVLGGPKHTCCSHPPKHNLPSSGCSSQKQKKGNKHDCACVDPGMPHITCTRDSRSCIAMHARKMYYSTS
jgi:hypothetical protein